MEKPLVFCMVPCCLLPDWEYLVISDFWKKKCADLRIKTGSLALPRASTADMSAWKKIKAHQAELGAAEFWHEYKTEEGAT